MGYAAAYWSVSPDQAGLTILFSKALQSLLLAAIAVCVWRWDVRLLAAVFSDCLLGGCSAYGGLLPKDKGTFCIQSTMAVMHMVP